MTIIEKLKFHENDQLEEWLDLDDKTTTKFLKELVKYANENKSELQKYCINILPTEYSSLSIVYEALSEYSTEYHTFLFEEIKRVVTLAKDNRIKVNYIEVLTDIETEDIYSKDQAIYIEILNFLTLNLNLNNDNNLNIQLLEIIDWFLIELDEDDDISESKTWINKIKNLANNSALPVKLKARKVLKSNDINEPLIPLSFLEKLKGVF